MSFTTRPELRGTFGMVASTHWIGSAVGMAVLERGGNAFDAAVACGFALQVVEPHQNGPGGDLTAVFWSAERKEPLVLCAQGVTPGTATIDAFRERGHDVVPGTGLLAACVPGAFDGWLTLLEQFGTMRLGEVMEPAIGYADDGYPVVPGIAAAVSAAEPLLAGWPASAALYLPVPRPGEIRRNRDLAAVYRRIVREAQGGSREREIARAREAFSTGFVAAAVDRYCEANDGLMRGDDLARWRATVEAPVTLDYKGLTVCKTGPWGQGPVMLQQLALLRGFDLPALGLNTVAYVHTVLECAKLAYADRDAFYGDPDFVDVPLERLLSAAYNDERRGLVTGTASPEIRPGAGGAEPPRTAAVPVAAGAGDPTRGDTVHLDIADRHGNLVSATPSGGWLQSSPVIPELGFPLGTRAQMLWLTEGLPSSLAPGKRPRTTLSPSLALRDGQPHLAFGTPGGDMQDQWPLLALLAHVEFGLDLQAAIDLPSFDTNHFPSSFFPRARRLLNVEMEARFPPEVVEGVRARGHEVDIAPGWSLGRVTAVGREADGSLKAAANPRGMQGYAAGR